MTKLFMRVGRALLFASVLLLGGCLFGSTANISVVTNSGGGEGGILDVSISFGGNWLSCNTTSSPGGGQTYSCAYFTPETLSSFGLSSTELMLFAFFIDPVVVEVPSAITNVRGTFAHTAGNGNLDVQGPLASVPIDGTRNLVAEAGTSLYIVSVPEAFENANPTGNYNFNLTMSAPLGTALIPAKAVITGHVRMTNGQNFYPAVFPCVTDMASAPGGVIDTTVPVSTLSLPGPATIPACRNANFSFASAGLAPRIPTLQVLALAALALLLGVATSLWSRRNR